MVIVNQGYGFDYKEMTTIWNAIGEVCIRAKFKDYSLCRTQLLLFFYEATQLLLDTALTDSNYNNCLSRRCRRAGSFINDTGCQPQSVLRLECAQELQKADYLSLKCIFARLMFPRVARWSSSQ